MPSTQLKRLPIPLLASPNCLVVTWVTNRSSHLRFVRDELYPHWGVEIVAEWFWVKVWNLFLKKIKIIHIKAQKRVRENLTSCLPLRLLHLGSLFFHLIHPTRSLMKFWFWADIVLKIQGKGINISSFSLSLLTCFTAFRSLEQSAVPVEDHRLMVSVPSVLHSQKPSLSGRCSRLRHQRAVLRHHRLFSTFKPKLVKINSANKSTGQSNNTDFKWSLSS